MQKIHFAYDSTALAEKLGMEKASEYLKLAEATYYQATILTIYGLILVLISTGLLVLIGIAFIGSEARWDFLQLDRVQAVFFSALPFTILGIYVSYRAHKIRQAAKEQADMFESSLTRAARSEETYG